MRTGWGGRGARRAWIALVLVVATTTATVASASGASRATRPAGPPAAGEVDFGVIGADALAAWSGATFTLVGPADPSLTLHLYLGLTSDRAALREWALAVSDPGSADYGRYGTVADEGARLNASPDTIAAVADWFGTRGVVLELDPTSTYFQGDVPVAVAAEAFDEEYGAFTVDELPSSFHVITPVVAPTHLAPGLDGLVDRVYGAVALIDTASSTVVTPEDLGRSPIDVGPEHVSPASFPYHPGGGGTPWRTGVASDACAEAAAFGGDGELLGLSPGQLRTAYGIDALWDDGFRGQGARVAVVDEAGYDADDLAAFRACFGVEGTPITEHVIGTPPSGPPDTETTLDLEVMTSIVPEAERIDWFVVDTTDSAIEGARSLFDMLVAPLDADLTGGVHPDVISSSFDECEQSLQQNDPGFAPMVDLLDQVLATAVTAGIGVFVASFDDGSSGCWRFLSWPENKEAAVVWPSTSRWVTAVGGTNLTLGPDNRIVSSGVWNDRAFGQEPDPPDQGVGGGGGGISVVYGRPAYQSGPGVPHGDARLVPDISAFSDPLPGYLVFYEGAWTFVGGTSAATPLTAGAFALQTSVARSRGQAALGFVNPLLYELARTDSGGTSAPLFDITIGTNDVWDIGVYPAGPHYDLATGLGSVMHDALAAALANRAAVPLVPRFTG